MPNVGEAQIRAIFDEGKTIVAEQFGKAPLQVHAPLYLENQIYPTMFLRTPSAGLLNGDVHRLNVHVGPSATLELRTQAATVVYPGASSIHVRIKVEDGGTFIFHPHKLILGSNARLVQDIEIILDNNSVLDMSDHWCAGRIAMGERWNFSSFSNSIRIWRQDSLRFVERFVIAPATLELTSRFICRDYNSFHTVFRFGFGHLQRPETNLESVSATDEKQVTWTMKREGDSVTRTLFS